MRRTISLALIAATLATGGAGFAFTASGPDAPRIEQYRRGCWYDLWTTRETVCGAAPVSPPVLVAGLGHPVLES